jgi:hypothetical protein
MQSLKLARFLKRTLRIALWGIRGRGRLGGFSGPCRRMNKLEKPAALLAYQSIGFLALIGLCWLDELVGLRSLVLDSHPFIQDFRESTLEMLLILGVWLVVAGSTRRLFARVRHLEGFMRVCSWCRRIEYNGTWMPLEKFFQQGFDTPTTHGICSDCAEKTRAAIAKAKQMRSAAAHTGHPASNGNG